MKFHPKKRIDQLSHHLKKFSLKNPQRIQAFVLRSNGFVEIMLENGDIDVEKEEKGIL